MQLTGDRMRISLIYPPVQARQSTPPLGLATLAGVLRPAGHNVLIHDLNLEFFRDAFTPSNMEAIAEYLRKRLNGVTGRSLSTLPAQAQYAAESAGLLAATRAQHSIVDAMEVMRDRSLFLNPPRLRAAHASIDDAMKALSGRFFPTVVDFAGYLPACSLNDWNAVLAEFESDSNPFHSFYSDVVNKLINERADIISVAVTEDTQIFPALSLCHAIRKAGYTGHISWGGDEVSKLASKLQQMPEFFVFVDSLLVVNAETSLLHVADSLMRGEAIDNVPNIVCATASGVVRTASAIGSSKVEHVPDFDGLKVADYFSPVPVLPIRISRGCYWNKCTFCTLNEAFSGYSQQLAKDAVDQIEVLAQTYGTECFRIADKAVAPRTMEKFCQELMRRGTRISWYAFTRGEAEFTQEITDLMARAGCCKVFVGAESASDATLARMKKGVRSEEIANYLERCHRSGIAVHTSFIVGFPGETAEEALRIPDVYLTNVQQTRSPGFSAYVFKFMLERGNDVWKSPSDFGLEILSPDTGVSAMQSYKSSGVGTPIEISRVRDDLNKEIWRRCEGKDATFDFFADYRFSDYVVYHSRFRDSLYDGSCLDVTPTPDLCDAPVGEISRLASFRADFGRPSECRVESDAILHEFPFDPEVISGESTKLLELWSNFAWARGADCRDIYSSNASWAGADLSECPPVVMATSLARRLTLQLDAEEASLMRLIGDNPSLAVLWSRYSTNGNRCRDDLLQYGAFLLTLKGLCAKGLVRCLSLDQHARVE
jgi:anaerobic magnesium-protoporphyrin IX monomethyl ester cyclase